MSTQTPTDQHKLKPEQIPLEAGFKGKVYAVSGGSSGMGRSTTLTLAHFGAYVSFCGRNEERISIVEAEVAE